MPEVSRFNGIVIAMYYGDPQRHGVPHFHARYGEYQASFAVEPPSWLSGIMPRKQMQLILVWAELHKDELLENWHRILNEEPMQKIEGLD